MDNELREQLKPMCLFAKTVSAQVGISAFNVALEEYKAVIVMRQYGTTLSYLEVADQMVDVIEAQDYLNEDQKESTKAMVVLAASLLSEFVDENFNIVPNAN